MIPFDIGESAEGIVLTVGERGQKSRCVLNEREALLLADVLAARVAYRRAHRSAERLKQEIEISDMFAEGK